jgi:hypothetical protein
MTVTLQSNLTSHMPPLWLGTIASSRQPSEAGWGYRPNPIPRQPRALTSRRTSPKSARPTSSVPNKPPSSRGPPLSLPVSFHCLHIPSVSSDDGQGRCSSYQHTSMRSIPSTPNKVCSQSISAAWVASPSASPWRRSSLINIGTHIFTIHMLQIATVVNHWTHQVELFPVRYR